MVAPGGSHLGGLCHLVTALLALLGQEANLHLEGVHGLTSQGLHRHTGHHCTGREGTILHTPAGVLGCGGGSGMVETV